MESLIKLLNLYRKTIMILMVGQQHSIINYSQALDKLFTETQEILQLLFLKHYLKLAVYGLIFLMALHGLAGVIHRLQKNNDDF